MNYILMMVVVLIGLERCNQTGGTNLHAVEVRTRSTYFGENAHTIYFVDELRAFYQRVPVDSFTIQLEIDSVHNQVAGQKKLTSTGSLDEYFIYHKDSVYGYMFTEKGNDVQRLAVDSVLKLIRGTNRWDNFLKVVPDTSKWKKKTELEEIFLIEHRKGMPGGRLTLSYSKELMHLKESFNSRVDSAKKMKLFKTEFLMDPYYDENTGTTWPPSKSVTEMHEIEVKNPDEIFEYIRKYKRTIESR